MTAFSQRSFTETYHLFVSCWMNHTFEISSVTVPLLDVSETRSDLNASTRAIAKTGGITFVL